MAIRLGDIAPNFEANTTEGAIAFHEWLGDSWGMIFSHPADFTPVCTTELGKTALLKGEFKKRNCKVIAVSVDDVDSHKKWISDIEQVNNVEMNFPIIGDENRIVAELYDMIHPNASEKATVRSVFIIGPDKKVKLTLTYPMAVGRNFLELLRVLDSLQLNAKFAVATPADWQQGEDVIVTLPVATEDIKAKYGVEADIKRPYLRYIPQPN